MTHRKRGLVAGILFLAVALTPIAAVSGPFEDGLDAYNVGDYVTAWWLWRPLAGQGDAAAQYGLGVMYERGQGVRQDYVQAHMWYSLAAARLPPGEDHDRAVEVRDAVAALMTPAQIAEAQKLAREWRPRGEQAE